MAVLYEGSHVVLQGQVSVEQAEALSQWLLMQNAPTVALAACTHLHAAVLQVLLVRRPAVVDSNDDPWLKVALARRVET